MKLFKSFQKDETGAVTVDWVVLTAGVVVLAGIAINAVSGALTNVTSVVEDAITGAAGGGGS